jgi:hypothetical protein
VIKKIIRLKRDVNFTRTHWWEGNGASNNVVLGHLFFFFVRTRHWLDQPFQLGGDRLVRRGYVTPGKTSLRPRHSWTRLKPCIDGRAESTANRSWRVRVVMHLRSASEPIPTTYRLVLCSRKVRRKNQLSMDLRERFANDSLDVRPNCCRERIANGSR